MILKLLIYLAILGYLVMSYYLFTEWLEFFLADEDMNAEQRFFSGIILVIATILWPLVVPFAYLELLKFQKKHKEVIDLVVNLSHYKVLDE